MKNRWLALLPVKGSTPKYLSFPNTRPYTHMHSLTHTHHPLPCLSVSRLDFIPSTYGLGWLIKKQIRQLFYIWQIICDRYRISSHTSLKTDNSWSSLVLGVFSTRPVPSCLSQTTHECCPDPVILGYRRDLAHGKMLREVFLLYIHTPSLKSYMKCVWICISF